MANNLYKISQDENDGYDTYSDAVVVAATEEEAQRIHPDTDQAEKWFAENEDDSYWARNSWAEKPEQVKVEFVGLADPSLQEGTVICASFHAG